MTAATIPPANPSSAACDLGAREAAARVLDAFYLQGRNLSEAEYAPLRDAMRQHAVLLLACPEAHHQCSDTVFGFLERQGAQVVAAEQSRAEGQRLLRVVWRSANDEVIGRLEQRFAAVGHALDARWRIKPLRPRPRIAVFVSQELHCLAAMLHEQRRGALAGDIALVVGNHPHAGALASAHGIAFHETPILAGQREAAERHQLELLRGARIDLVVLARYMRILSPSFVARFPERIINVHHSLLPAFAGGRAYQRAFERGVRVIGATSHYVNEALDDGPIIDQRAVQVPPNATIEQYIALGRGMEQAVLRRAVRWHLEHRLWVGAGKTVVFRERLAGSRPNGSRARTAAPDRPPSMLAPSVRPDPLPWQQAPQQ